MSTKDKRIAQESILGPIRDCDGQMRPKRGLYTGTSLSILDLYACHPDSQGLVLSQISNFITNNKEDFSSFCGRKK